MATRNEQLGNAAYLWKPIGRMSIRFYTLLMAAVPIPLVSTLGNERIAPTFACDGPSTNNMKGMSFQFRSATLTLWNQGLQSHIRVTLGIQNSTDTPIGVFMYQNETSVSADTGLEFYLLQVSGISLCNSNRENCTKVGTMTPIAAGATINVILTLQGQGPHEEQAKRQLSDAKSIDFSGIVYASTGSDSGYLPMSCIDMPLRNMVVH